MARKVMWFAVGAVATVAVGMTPFISFAEEDPAAPAPVSDSSDFGVSPDMAAAMKRDLDLTDDELRARLDTEATAPKIQERLEAKLGKSFGGAWIPESGDVLKVAVTDPADAAAVEAEGAEAEVVKRSEADLTKSHDKLDASAEDAGTGITGWYVDVESNTVVVQALPGKEQQAKQFAKDAGAGTVSVETVTGKPKLTDGTLIGGDGYYNATRNTSCSIGFPAVSKSDTSVSGFLTAGHCGTAGQQAVTSDSDLGVFAASDFPSNGNDWAWVETTDGWNGQAAVDNYNDTANDEPVISGTQEAAQGSAVCQSGATSKYQCGTLRVKNFTVKYPQGNINVYVTSICGAAGDSGGAVISEVKGIGVQAQGLVSGVNCDDPKNSVTYYQPLTSEILEKLPATVATTPLETIQTALDTSKCIDVPGSNLNPGQTVQMYTCNNTDAQKWAFQLVNGTGPSNSKIPVVNVLTRNSLCLGLQTGTSYLELNNCYDKTEKLSLSQQFTYDSSTGRLLNPQSGKCADIKGGKPVDTAGVIVYTCKTKGGDDNQTWKKVKSAASK